MKIKEVMERTGLTDRAIRHYIECGLLFPHSDDTYTGRKNYTFTREDVEQLETIKAFRQAGFGIEQIKQLLTERSSRQLVQERLAQLEAEKRRSEQLIETLQKADIDREVSPEELAIILSSCPTKEVIPQEIYAPTPVRAEAPPQEEKPFAMRSTWWRKLYGETTVEIKDTVQGVIAKMRQQQRERDTDFRCSKNGNFRVRPGSLMLKGKVFAQNGNTMIRFYEVHMPVLDVLCALAVVVFFPIVLLLSLFELFHGHVVWAVDTFDFLGAFSGSPSESTQEELYHMRNDMLRQIEAIRRWDE